MVAHSFDPEDPLFQLLRLLQLSSLSEQDRERKYNLGEEEFESLIEDLEDRLRAEGWILEEKEDWRDY